MFSAVSLRVPQPVRARTPFPSTPSSVKQQPRFGMLIKISGDNAVFKKHGRHTYTLATAIENADHYEKNPEEFELGYYREPGKPYDIWMASNDADQYDKSTLDAAKAKSPDVFAQTLQTLIAKKGITNSRLDLRGNRSVFVKTRKTPHGKGFKLENPKAMADEYRSHPSDYWIGYFRDPEKPNNIWIADGDARAVLDRVQAEQPNHFPEIFKVLKMSDGIRSA